jgi:hypothetical protein
VYIKNQWMSPSAAARAGLIQPTNKEAPKLGPPFGLMEALLDKLTTLQTHRALARERV